MNIFLVGGLNISNVEWLKKIKKHFEKSGNSAEINNYKHRDFPNTEFDFDYEYNNLSQQLTNQKDYYIFAKSVGTLLISKFFGHENRGTNCKGLILVGSAISLADKLDLPVFEWINNIDIPILIIQQEFDPACNYKDLIKKISQKDNISLVMIEGNDHKYSGIKQLNQIIGNWINR